MQFPVNPRVVARASALLATLTDHWCRADAGTVDFGTWKIELGHAAWFVTCNHFLHVPVALGATHANGVGSLDQELECQKLLMNASWPGRDGMGRYHGLRRVYQRPEPVEWVVPWRISQRWMQRSPTTRTSSGLHFTSQVFGQWTFAAVPYLPFLLHERARHQQVGGKRMGLHLQTVLVARTADEVWWGCRVVTQQAILALEEVLAVQPPVAGLVGEREVVAAAFRWGKHLVEQLVDSDALLVHPDRAVDVAVPAALFQVHQLERQLQMQFNNVFDGQRRYEHRLVLPSVLGQQQRRFLFDLAIPKEGHIVF
jgi:hypothetical protein